MKIKNKVDNLYCLIDWTDWVWDRRRNVTKIALIMLFRSWQPKIISVYSHNDAPAYRTDTSMIAASGQHSSSNPETCMFSFPFAVYPRYIDIRTNVVLTRNDPFTFGSMVQLYKIIAGLTLQPLSVASKKCKFPSKYTVEMCVWHTV